MILSLFVIFIKIYWRFCYFMVCCYYNYKYIYKYIQGINLFFINMLCNKVFIPPDVERMEVAILKVYLYQYS
jgi:hypothetical protein